MALRGKPRLPFYMVGRMEGQSVVLRAEKGRLRLSVDAEEDDKTQEVIYNLNEEGNGHGEDKEREEAAADELRGDGEMQGSTVGMDGEAQTSGDMPGAVDTLDGACALAEAGDGGDAPGAGVKGEPGQRPGSFSSLAGAAGEEAPDALDEHSAGQAGKDTIKGTGSKESRDVSVKGPEVLRRSPAQI